MADGKPTDAKPEPTIDEQLKKLDGELATATTAQTTASKALESARRDASVDVAAFVALSTDLNVTTSAVNKITARMSTVKRSKNSAAITELTTGLGELVTSDVDAIAKDMAKLEITGFAITVTTGEGGLRQTNVKATGPGAVTTKAAGGTGERRGRATLPDGQSWAGIATEAGVFVAGANNHKVVFSKAREIHDSIPHECQFTD